ncbi:thiamine diphosphokinase [Fusobacterium pseudoperiodonticum]|uniref:thiamine diphosphokinase n=1 Tax=Fusobacterium pseudoperiodonticum TaxID=2663009 RepID=UPI000C1BDCCE|nr:thiamine diphosphokinase [Fusobacterium pseudoperiodonticum]ATV63654.1 thiamine diphosphokinase [Fusobacterium pseudoperiodonticum]
MKIAYLFFNGQLRGSKKFYSNLIKKQEGDIYCADGGANIVYQLNLIPKKIYGDLDSIKDEVKDFYTKKNVKFIKFNVEKDYTDSELVLNEIEKKYDKIYAIAALGGSIDHELTNINLLNRYSNLIFVSQKEKMFKIEKSYDFSNMKNKKVSFIIFSDKVENLTLKGFKYSVENLDLTKGETRCVSNIIEKNEARVTLKNGALLCVVK